MSFGVVWVGGVVGVVDVGGGVVAVCSCSIGVVVGVVVGVTSAVVVVVVYVVLLVPAFGGCVCNLSYRTWCCH